MPRDGPALLPSQVGKAQEGSPGPRHNPEQDISHTKSTGSKYLSLPLHLFIQFYKKRL